MTPYLKDKIDQYEHHRSVVADVRTILTRERREPTPAEVVQVIQHGDLAKALYAEIELLQDEELRNAKVGQMSARVAEALTGSDGQPAAASATGLWSLLPDREQLAQLRTAGSEGRGLRFTTARLPRDKQEETHLRAAVTLSLTGGVIGGLSGALPEPRRLARAVGLASSGSTTAGVSGPKFGATTAAAPTAEGAAKPEAATITKLDIPIKQLARWTTVSRMALLSTPDFAEQLVSWHGLYIAKDEDKLIIDAVNAAAGAAVAFVAGDQRLQIRKAMAVVEDAVSASCDVVLCHTDDYQLIAGFDVTSVDDLGAKPVLFGGAVLYPSASVPTGFVLVAALRAAGAFIVADPPSVVSLPALSTNEVTFRTEELVGFDLRLVGAARKVDVVTP